MWDREVKETGSSVCFSPYINSSTDFQLWETLSSKEALILKGHQWRVHLSLEVFLDLVALSSLQERKKYF